jgi:outer membrane protein assembly factor BamB/cold shock CspA family protein
MWGVVTGVVREWWAGEGWGIVDSPETPGGCWVHFSSIEMPGYHALTAGERVELAWERAAQDGYSFRAVRVVPSRAWRVESVDLPGQPGSLAAAGPTGPVYVLTGSTDGVRLCAVDLDGRLLWARPVDAHRGPRVAGDGGIWVAGRTVLEQTRPGGEPGRRFTLDSGHPQRAVGAFALLPDGPLVAWESRAPDAASVRLERLDPDGRRRWVTDLPAPDMASARITEIGVESGWQPRPIRTYRAATFQATRWAPLLVSGDRVLATFFEISGGLGVSYCVDLDTGRPLWSTEPAPDGDRALAGGGRFLVGEQGYGAFAMRLLDRDGTVVAKWPSHGRALVGGDGVIRVVELENVTPSRSRIRLLHLDGTMTDGPVLPGYHTVGPVLARDGRVAFFRDGRLQVAAPELTVTTGYVMPGREGVGGMLLLDGGLLAFTTHQAHPATGSGVLSFARTDLPGQAGGPWTGAEANLRANPVTS